MDVNHKIISLIAEFAPSSSIFPGAKAQQYVMLALGFAGLAVLWLTTRRKARSITRADRKRLGGHGESGVQSAIRDVATAMKDLDSLSEQVHSQLDAKIAKLEALIRVADDRIDRLGRTSRSAGGQPTVDVLADDADRGATNEAQNGDRSSMAMGDSLVPSAHEAIYALADAGTPVLQIARQMNRPRGEIELILSLRATAQSVRSATNN